MAISYPSEINSRLVNNVSDKLFDKEEFVEKSIKGDYVLIIGSEVILDKTLEPTGDSSIYIAKGFSSYLKEKEILGKEYDNFSEIPLKKETIRFELTNWLDNYMEYKEKEMSSELRKLINSRCFKIVMTTTIDGYLETLMENVWGKENLNIVNIYNTDSLIKFAKELEESTRKNQQIKNPTLVYIFGKAQSKKQYVATDEDAIEAISKWIKGEDSLQEIIDKLSVKNILALGCRLENWHFRFFWHMIKPIDTKDKYKKGDAIAISSFASGRDSDIALKYYLQNHQYIHTRPDIREFIKECADSFSLSDNRFNSTIKQLIYNLRNPSDNNKIFISYAHEDFPLAMHIFTRLNQEGFNVWIDNKDLHIGDDYKSQIQLSINNCSIFMPILTPAVAARLEKPDEWNFLVNDEWEFYRQRRNINGDKDAIPICALLSHGYDMNKEYHKRYLKLMGEHTVFNLNKESFSKLIEELKLVAK